MTRRRIFYLAYDHGNPSGGIKEAYRHVEILNRHGIDAFILHEREGAIAGWFDHEAPVVSRAEFLTLYSPVEDIVVIPEDMMPHASAFQGPRVIFNQNVFYGFASLGMESPKAYPYLDPGVKAAFCVSPHNGRFLRYAFPRLTVHELTVGIDFAKFEYRPLAEKRRRICLYVKKNPIHNLTLYHLACARAAQDLGGLRDVEWAILDGRQTEDQVAAVLSESLVFVFLSNEEGNPLMPLEAAACGTLPFVYDTCPAADWAPRDCQFRYGDLPGILDTIERVVATAGDELQPWQAIARQAYDGAGAFSLAARERALLDGWEKVFGQLA